MKKLIVLFFVLFFSSLSSMQEPFHRPTTQIMDEKIQPDKTPPQKEQHYNSIDCGCIEGCAKFCFWAGAPTCLALIILTNKFMRGSSSDYTE